MCLYVLLQLIFDQKMQQANNYAYNTNNYNQPMSLLAKIVKSDHVSDEELCSPPGLHERVNLSSRKFVVYCLQMPTRQLFP